MNHVAGKFRAPSLGATQFPRKALPRASAPATRQGQYINAEPGLASNAEVLRRYGSWLDTLNE